jgi:hypothetical protein
MNGRSRKDNHCFRGLRNQFVHHGFSPESNSRATTFIAAVGIPYYALVLKRIAEEPLFVPATATDILRQISSPEEDELRHPELGLTIC